ncbi:MAG TPA: hypothetical protein VEP30_08935 [Chthoniobacterales bacterium]|nr:hypothetical protein [Chthoniobacterales bacterium]
MEHPPQIVWPLASAALAISVVATAALPLLKDLLPVRRHFQRCFLAKWFCERLLTRSSDIPHKQLIDAETDLVHLATTFVAFPLLAKTTQLKTYGCIAIVLLAGCTSTQVRWDATNIRKQVMVYYNDQIMDNLIKAKNHVPFVHVDITLLTSQGSSQISGTLGAGESRTHTDSPAGTILRAVTRPFTYSVTPQQTETLSITSAPALGSQALAAPSTYPPVLTATKKTTAEVTDAQGTPGNITTTTERTLEALPRENIYQLYEKFAASHLSYDPTPPQKDTYVPGTLKRWGSEYYYIKQAEGLDYYKFCKELFLKGQTGSLEKALQQVQSSAALQH